MWSLMITSPGPRASLMGVSLQPGQEYKARFIFSVSQEVKDIAVSTIIIGQHLAFVFPVQVEDISNKLKFR